MSFDWLKSLRNPSHASRSTTSRLSAPDSLEHRAIPSAISIGPEFHVTAATTSTYQLNVFPQIAVDKDGDFVVAWERYDEIGKEGVVYARKYNADGSPADQEFRVSSNTTMNQQDAAIAMNSNGEFVVAWQNSSDDGIDIHAQIFTSDGSPIGSEIQVNSMSGGNQSFPSIDMDDVGNFIVTWSDSEADGNGWGIFARRFNSSGTPLESEFRVNSDNNFSQWRSSVAMSAQGDFVIAWESDRQDGDQNGVFAQRFNASGTPVGVEFKVNVETLRSQRTPKVAMDAEGDFVITWESEIGDGSLYGVFARSYDAEGSTVGSPFQVNTFTSSSQFSPAIAMNSDGDFVISWTSFGQDGDKWGVFAQRYDSTAIPQGAEFRINSVTLDNQHMSSIAIDADGDFVTAWSDLEPLVSVSSDFSDIYAQRYRSPHPDQLAAWRSGKFYLDSNHSKTWNGSTTDTLNTFGSTTDKPIAGDWNGDAYTDIAVWRNGTFYIDANGNGTWDGAATDKSFKFGLNTDTPIVGDWNGDGQDDIGVWRGGKFYLDLDGNRIWNSAIDKSFTFGSASDTPIIGDWNADGIDDLGVWRSGKFYLDLNANRVWNSGVDGIFAFGLNTDTPLIGDWNADGTDDIAVWRNGKFYQDSNGNRAWNSATDTVTTFGTTTDTPLIGYWRPKTIPGTPPNATPAPSPTPSAPLSIQVTPTAVTPFDFSGRWNYTGDTVNGFIRVNQIGKKASTLLRIGDLEFDMNAKIKADRLTGKFSKNLPEIKIRGKFEATRINSTTFSGLLTISTNGTPAQLPILGTRV